VSGRSIASQYEEVECTYLERRNDLVAARWRVKNRPPEEVLALRALRLETLKLARDTLYRLALDEGADGLITPPQDYEAPR